MPDQSLANIAVRVTVNITVGTDRPLRFLLLGIWLAQAGLAGPAMTENEN